MKTVQSTAIKVLFEALKDLLTDVVSAPLAICQESVFLTTRSPLTEHDL